MRETGAVPRMASRKRFAVEHPRACPREGGGGSRMRESRAHGSVRGTLSNGRPFRAHDLPTTLPPTNAPTSTPPPVTMLSGREPL